MNKKIIVSVTTSSFAEYSNYPLGLLRKAGCRVILNPYRRKLKSKELFQVCGNSVGIIAGTEILSKDVLRKLTQLKVVSRCGAGLDNVDLACARKLGIKVYNTPDAPTVAVAELTIGLILNLLRKVSLLDRTIRNGDWQKDMGNLLSGKKVGILGFGRIGKKVSQLLKPFSCEIAYYDPLVIKEAKGCKRLSKNRLLSWADILTVHAAGNETLLGHKEISLLKRGSWLVNTSRGEIIDERALYNALKRKHLKGAALDVFAQEPYSGKLIHLDNTVLTPHIGSYAQEARAKMEIQAAENLLRGLKASKII